MYQKCPVCEGKGIVPPGFYNLNVPFTTNTITTTAKSAETCRTCQGSGVIYNPEYSCPWHYDEKPWWKQTVYTTSNDSTNSL